MADEPWLKYGAAPAAEPAGPWQKYAAPAATEASAAPLSAREQHVKGVKDLLTEHPFTTTIGFGENALSAVTGGVGSLGEVLTGKEPGTYDTAYQPRTEAGKAIQKLAGEESAEVGRRYDQAFGTGPAAQTIKERIPQALGAIGTVTGIAEAPKVAAGAKALGKGISEGVKSEAGKIATAGEEKAAIRNAQEAPKANAIKEARAMGLKLDPNEAGGGAIGRGAASIGGKVQTEQTLSRANAKVINQKAAADVGIGPKESLSEANITRQKQQQFKVYDRVKKAGPVNFDDAYREELRGVLDRTGQEATDFPEDANERIEKEIRKFDRPSADASSVLEKIKGLRERASRNMKALDGDTFELGIAQKKIATAMENQLERQLRATDPKLIADFRNARTQLAKLYSIEDAVSPSGNVSAAVLARQLKRGVPLSGNLKAIAQAYQEFPKVMRTPESMGGHGPFSALDYLVGGVAGIGTGHVGGAAAIAARPAARGLVASEFYQKRGIKPAEVKPSRTARLARKIAGPRIGDLPETRPNQLDDYQ